MTLVIKAGKLIDGQGGDPLMDALVVVQDGRIVQVGKAEAIAPLAGATVIDATGKTVMPGMIDAHVHIDSPGSSAPGSYALRMVQELVGTQVLRGYVNGKISLEAGFTTLRSLGSAGYADIALRNAIDEGLVEGPRLRVSGIPLSVTGGHSDPTFAPHVSIAGRALFRSPDGAREAARTQLKMGADCIKLSGISVSNLPRWEEAGFSEDDPERPYRQEMTLDEIKAACEEAHWAGKTVAAHSSGGRGQRDGILGGVDTIEHGMLTDEHIELMAERGTFYVPTFSTSMPARTTKKPETEPEVLWRWRRRNLDIKLEYFWKVLRAGVKVALGTDAGYYLCPHGRNAYELELLVLAGMTPMQAIVAGTKTAAEALGMARQVGTIEAGKYADLLIVTGDPSKDVKLLQDKEKVGVVMKGGQVVVDRRQS
jgi:imidazolonepropionase-like amidohydrolase